MTQAQPTVKMTDPVLVFGGPYSNLEATQALLEEARRLQIPPSRIVCTGDLCAYCADPQAVVDLLRASGVRVVMGNCEESLATDATGCGCGFSEESACAALSELWYRYANSNIDSESRVWMGSLPHRIDLEIGGRRLAVIHGGVNQINRFVFASSDEAVEEELAAADCDGVIGGHCGLPFTRQIGGRLWHNAGAIGLPANDGTARTWFSILTPSQDGILIDHRALDYDYARAAAKMRECGLPEGYASALETGLWPSYDVLAPTELEKRGQRLEPGRVLWRLPGANETREARFRSDACWPA